MARAIDGDSLEVRADDDHTIIEVRLQDVDAPEFDQPEGPIAGAKLRRILRTGECTVEPRGLDRYGRLVAKVRRADGKDIGLCMIAAGYAVAVAERPRVYVACERQARAEGRGAWGHGGFVHPSEWRRAQAG